MKVFINILLTVMIAILGWQSFNLYKQHEVLEVSANKINSDVSSIDKENQDLNADIEYFSNPENLVKELKGKMNYKNSDEKMIIVVPPQE